MTVNYTSLLGLALPVTGTEAGAWGDVVNNYLTSYLDASVAGTQTITGSQTAVTLAVTNGATLVTVGSGATGSAQFQIITCTGNPASLLTITAPASSRQYIIINSTSTSQSVQIVGAGPTTGVTIVSGEKAHVAWNGSDFVKIATQSGNGSFVDLTVSGNLTLSGGTQNGVLYLNASKVATSGSALTFDGTSLGVNSASPIDGGRFSVAFAGNTQNGIGLKDTADASGASFWGAYNSTGGFIGSLRRSSTDNALAINGNSYLAFQQNSTELMRLTSTGLKASIAGTNADPVFSYTSDTNTGIFFPAADKLGFTAGGGSDQMVLTTTGLGIGTNNPTTKLDVQGIGAAIRLKQNDTGSATYYQMDNTVETGGKIWRFGYTGGSGIPTFSLFNQTDNVLSWVADSSGNLGLGVTPSASWVAGASAFQQSVGSVHSNTSLGSYDVAYNSIRTASDSYIYGQNGLAATRLQQRDGSFRFFNAPSGTANSASVTSGASYTVVALGSSTLNQWKDFFNDSSNNPLTVTPTLGQVLTGNATGTLLGGGLVTQNISFTQAMTLDASGRLGIGATNPAAKLQVAGGNIRLDNNQGIEWGGGTNFIYGNNSTNILVFTTNNTERARISSDGTFRVKGAGTAGSTDAVQFSGSAPASTLILDSSGRLGVGTSSPNYLIHSQTTSTNITTNLKVDADAAANNYAEIAFQLWSGAGTGLNTFGGGGNSRPSVVLRALSEDASARGAFVVATFSGGATNATLTEKARITSDGNLGIGTVSPSNRVQSRRDATTDASNSQFIAENRTGAVGQYTLYGSRLDDGAGAGFTPVAFGAVQTDAAGRKADFVIAVSDTDNIDLSTDIRARIDSSGNLGLGVTISDWQTGGKFQVGAGQTIGSVGNGLVLASNWYYNTGGKFAGTGYASYYNQEGGVHSWHTSTTSGSIGNNAVLSQAMTLDASGNLGVGETSPSTYGKITLKGGKFSLVTDTAAERRVSFWSTANGNSENAYIQVQNDGATTNTGEMLFATKNSGGTLAERARIDSSGNLVVGATSTSVKFEVSVVGTASYSAAAAPTANILLSTTGSSNSRYTSIGIGSRGTSGQNQTNYISSIPEASDGYSSLTFSTYGNYAVAERARITSDGNLGVGETNPASRLHVTVSGTAEVARFETTTNNTPSVGIYSNGGIRGKLRASTAEMAVLSQGSIPLLLGVNDAEKAQITSSGYFKASDSGAYTNATGLFHEFRQTASDQSTIYCTNTSAIPYGIRMSYTGAAPNGTDNWFLYCEDSGPTQRASIRSNGGFANYSANDVNLASDRRLKNTIEPMRSYYDVFKNLSWVTWLYNDQTDDLKNHGVIAQELQALAPEFVCESEAKKTPEGETPYLGIWEQDFKMAGMSVITELIKKIEKLEAEVAALKGA